MAVERVGIEIDIMGYGDAMSQMRNLDAAVKGLQGRKNYLKIKAQVEELKMNKKALQSNKVKLKADMTDVDAKIKKLRSQLKSLEAQKPLYKMNSAAFTKLAQKIAEVKTELRSLEGQRINLGEQFAQTTAEINESTAAIGRYEHALKNAGMASMSLNQIFKSISSKSAHIGSAMQSLGNAITKVSSPMRSLARMTVFAGGFAMLGMAREGIASATQRYDIIKTYTPIMEALGNSGKDAEKAISALNDAVLGVPTGLDEIVEQHKLLTMALGDMTKATDLAIASNNAWLASGADESRVTMAKKELQTLAQTGKLNERQWMTMQKGMSVTWNEIEKKMKSTGKIQGSLLEALKDGTVSAQEFMDALVVEGMEGKTAVVKEEIAHTFQSVTSNIQNAFARLGENVIKTLDDILLTATGKDTIDTLKSLTKGIDKMSEGVQNWIKSNPDVLLDFLDAIKSYDWADLGKGIGDGAKALLKLATGFTKILPSPRVMGWLMTFGSLFGTALTTIGGIVKGGRHIVGGLGSLLVGIGRAFASFGAEAAEKKVSKIGKLFKNLGKTEKTVNAADEAAKAANGGKAAGAATKAYFVSLGKVLAAVGAGIAIAVGSTWGLKTSLKQLKETADLMKEIDWAALKPVGRAAGVLATVIGGAGALMKTVGTVPAAGSIAKAFLPVAEIVGAIGGIITEVLAIGAIDTALLNVSMNNLVSITGGMQKVFDNVAGIKGKFSEAQADKLRDSVNNLFSIYDIINGETTSKKAVGKNIITQKNKRGLAHMSGSDLKSIADSLGQMKRIFGTMKQIDDAVKELKNFKGFDEKSLDAVTNFATDLGKIYDSMIDAFNYEVDDNKAEMFAGIMEQSEGMVNSIVEIAKQMPKLEKKLLGIMKSQGVGGMGHSTMSQIRELLGGEHGMFAYINDIYSAVNQYLLGTGDEAVDKANRTSMALSKGSGGKLTTGSGAGPVGSGGISKITSAMENVKNMFTHISELVTMLKEMEPDLTAMTQQGSGEGGRGNALASLKTHIVQLMSDLGQIYDEFQTSIGSKDTGSIVSDMERMVEAIDQIKTAANKLKELGAGALADGGEAISPAIEGIKSMIDQLGKAINTETIAGIKEQVEQFKASIDEIFTTLNSDYSNVEVEVHINGKVTGWKELVTEIRQANDAIARMVNSIQTHYVKNITVELHRSVSVTGTDPSTVNVNGGGGWHTGGLIDRRGPIYRAKGGGIGDLFKPKGTDTVPAMLTPGEYVMKKQAVDNFGVRFMQRINNLDIAGAMRELSAKAGITSAAARSTVVYNNITNNNSPTINQSISTNNPNFAFKRSNRYVMAL